MSELLIMKRFLDSHRSKKGFPYNFVCLKKATGIFRQGTFFIPEAHRADFWKYYSDAVPHFSAENCPSIAYKPPSRTMQPLCIDVDFRFSNETKLDPSGTFKFTVDIANQLAKICQKTVNFYIVYKNNGYFKQYSEDKLLYTNGFHIYFSNVRIPQRVASDIKKYAESIVLDFFGHLTPLNPPDDIIDHRVIQRKNGLMLLGTYKNIDTGGRYLMRFMGSVEQNGTISDLEVKEDMFYAQLEDLLANTYNFVWESEKQGDEKTEEPHKKKRKIKHVVNEKIAFNLEKFLEVTKTHRATHHEWLQIVFYCASIGVPREQMELLGNRNHSCPYKIYDSRQPGNDEVSRGSIIRYLNRYATEFVTDELFKEIFPQRVFEYLSEYNDFLFSTGTTWSIEILTNFLTDTICYIQDCKKYVYRDFKVERDEYGNKIKRVTTYITDVQPFSKGEDIIVRIPYESKSLIEIIESMKKNIKKHNDNLVDLKARLRMAEDIALLKEPTPSIIQRISKQLNLPPNELVLSDLLKQKGKKGYIRRYRGITFRPYLFVDLTEGKTYNTFNPFPLLKYKPTEVIDWRKTALYDFFFNVYAWGEQEKFEGFMNLIAYWIQHPNKRDDRIIVLLSEKQGLGKSKLSEILSKLMGPGLVVFFNSYADFADSFNFQLANRLVWFIDDVSGIHKTQAQSLNSKATAKVMRFNEKNEKSFFLPICNTIILTSNERNPLYCPPEDRRQMYIKVSPCYKG